MSSNLADQADTHVQKSKGNEAGWSRHVARSSLCSARPRCYSTTLHVSRLKSTKGQDSTRPQYPNLSFLSSNQRCTGRDSWLMARGMSQLGRCRAPKRSPLCLQFCATISADRTLHHLVTAGGLSSAVHSSIWIQSVVECHSGKVCDPDVTSRYCLE